jgi:hypothetical protein
MLLMADRGLWRSAKTPLCKINAALQPTVETRADIIDVAADGCLTQNPSCHSVITQTHKFPFINIDY